MACGASPATLRVPRWKTQPAKIFIARARNVAPERVGPRLGPRRVEHLRNYGDAVIEVARLRELRSNSKRERDEAEFLNGLDDGDEGNDDDQGSNDGDSSAAAPFGGQGDDADAD